VIHTIRAGDSSQLQSAINLSQPGDEIVASPALPYLGSFHFPDKAGEVRLRTSATLPDRRVTQEDAHLLFTLNSGSSAPALEGNGAKNWLIDGIRGLPNVYGEVFQFTDAENIRVQRFLIDVPDGTEQKRGILANGNNLRFEAGHVSGVRRPGQDSQAIASWEGDGLEILDCFLEAASENILIGGSDPRSEALMSRNVRIEGCHLFKRLAWKLGLHQIKNLAEFKSVIGAVLCDNLMENCWSAPDGQPGYGLVITPRNQDGSAPFAQVKGLSVYGNTMLGVQRGVNITGHDDTHPSQQTTDVVIRDNRIDTRDVAFLLHKEIGKLDIYRNAVTMPPDRAFVSFENESMWKTGDPAPRKATYAVDDLTFAQEAPAGTYIHSPNLVGYAGTELGLRVLMTFTRAVDLDLPSDAPLPSVPPVQDGAPTPLPGEQVEAPSLPEVDDMRHRLENLEAKFVALHAEVGAVDGDLLAVASTLKELLAYLGDTPKVTRIEQLRSYIKGAGQ
jgi:hypothetical protein